MSIANGKLITNDKANIIPLGRNNITIPATTIADQIIGMILFLAHLKNLQKGRLIQKRSVETD